MKDLVWTLSTAKFKKKSFPFFQSPKYDRTQGQTTACMSVPTGPGVLSSSFTSYIRLTGHLLLFIHLILL